MRPYPALTIIPDFTEAPRFMMSTDSEVVRLAPAEALVLFPEEEVTRMFTHRFKLTERAEIEALKAFFRDRAGRCRPFYLPSWRDDLTLVSANTNSVTVVNPSIAAGHGDSHTRTLFVWQGDDLHVARWTQSTVSGGNVIYWLESPLTFSPIAGQAMVGWAHLCRFSDDRLRIRHRRPYLAEAEIGFRSQRAWSAIAQTVSMTPLAYDQSPGFTSGVITADALLPMEQRVAYARGPDPADTEITTVDFAGLNASDMNSTSVRLYRANGTSDYFWFNVDATGSDPATGDNGNGVALSFGDLGEAIAAQFQGAVNTVPSHYSASRDGTVVTITSQPAGARTNADPLDSGTALIITQEGSPSAGMTVQWAAWVGSDGIPRLKQTASPIVLPDATGTPSALFSADEGIERLSLAFDHALNQFIAYQVGDDIKVRWYTGATAKLTTIAGAKDPVLAYNWFTDTGMASGLAEVVLYYRKEGDNRLYARHENEEFGDERVAATLPVKAIDLRGIDQTLFKNLLIADANWRLCTLISA